MSFVNDLKQSQQRESILADNFIKGGYTVTTTQTKGKFADYDLTVTSSTNKITCTIEYKHDIMADRTGNACIEIYKTVNNVNQPSGLTATKADVYVYQFGLEDGTYYAINVKALKRFIKENKDNYRTLNGGDGLRSRLVLLPVADFKKIAKPLFINNISA